MSAVYLKNKWSLHQYRLIALLLGQMIFSLKDKRLVRESKVHFVS